jgi:photosystem II stability/assembly factor-like uncharacterized protein
MLPLLLASGGPGQERAPAAARPAPASLAPTGGLQDADSAEDVFTALQQLGAMRQQVGLQAKVAGLPVGVQVESKDLTPKVGGLTPGGWKWLGPDNLGGTTLALLSYPRDPRLMWAGSKGGGLWHSTNAGEHWTIVNESLAGIPVSCLAIDPANPEVIYAGTGDGYDYNGISGIGILKSTDSGATWKRLASSADFYWINQLAVSADGHGLLAATPIGLYRSSDGGDSWKQAADIGEVPIQNVSFHPAAAQRCVASGWRGAAYSSSDSGLSWSRAEGLPNIGGQVGNRAGRVVVACAAAAADVVYASVDSDGGRLYRSRDGGHTFTATQNDEKYLEGGGIEEHCLWAGDPTRPDLVVAGAYDLWRSLDGGKTLEKISDWKKVELPQKRIFFKTIVSHGGYNGTDSRTLYVGTWGGIGRIEDITTVSTDDGWQILNNGYGGSEMVGVAGNAATGTIVAGCNTHGTLLLSRDGAGKWTFMAGGNGGNCAADPKDPQCFYGCSWCLQLNRTLDGGKTVQWIDKGIKDAGSYDNALHQAPFVLDPNDSRVLLAGGKSLWRTSDARAGTPVWKPIKRSNGQLISAIAVSPGSADTIWVGHANGALFQTSNGSAEAPAWKLVGERLPRKRFCSRIVFDPANPRRVFVTYRAYEANNLWRTEDGGENWTNIPIKAENTRPLATPCNDLAIHPSNPRCLYLATQVGVFASENGGQSWSPTNEGPTGCPVRQLIWMDKTLVAATEGRGVFQIDLSGVRAARAASEP